jgi:outer membrane lipoprotein-sorting protein
VNYDAFITKNSATKVQIVKNDGAVAAVYDGESRRLYAIFWGVSGGSAQVTVDGSQLTLTSNKNSAVIYDIDLDSITASDPSQTLSSFQIGITHFGTTKTLTVNLPSGGMAGSSVII